MYYSNLRCLFCLENTKEKGLHVCDDSLEGWNQAIWLEDSRYTVPRRFRADIEVGSRSKLTQFIMQQGYKMYYFKNYKGSIWQYISEFPSDEQLYNLFRTQIL